jgi:hypothetical protein
MKSSKEISQENYAANKHEISYGDLVGVKKHETSLEKGMTSQKETS